LLAACSVNPSDSTEMICSADLDPSSCLQVRREEAQDRPHLGRRLRCGMRPHPRHPIRCVRADRPPSSSACLYFSHAHPQSNRFELQMWPCSHEYWGNCKCRFAFWSK
jgi:hypothetical protein